MAMQVVNAGVLAAACRKNIPLRKAVDRWLEIAEAADWKNIADVRRTFPGADGVAIRRGETSMIATVFNIRGNEYRLITVINYSAVMILIRELLTHAEYSKESWKIRL